MTPIVQRWDETCLKWNVYMAHVSRTKFIHDVVIHIMRIKWCHLPGSVFDSEWTSCLWTVSTMESLKVVIADLPCIFQRRRFSPSQRLVISQHYSNRVSILQWCTERMIFDKSDLDYIDSTVAYSNNCEICICIWLQTVYKSMVGKYHEVRTCPDVQICKWPSLMHILK